MSVQPAAEGVWPDAPLCEVCGQRPAVGVACVTGIPLSVAYCRQCLAEGADPLAYVRANVACCGGPEHVSSGYLDGVRVYYEGRYMSLREQLRLRPMTEEELIPDDELIPSGGDGSSGLGEGDL